jgi:hypothetical protein
MLRAVVHEQAGLRVVAMDSISSVLPEDRGQVVVSASNGGDASGRVAADYGLGFVVTNDAGVGKDDAGIAGMRDLDAAGIPAVTVSHVSAEISNGEDTWRNGVVSFVNQTAARDGALVGAPVQEVVLRWLRQR